MSAIYKHARDGHHIHYTIYFPSGGWLKKYRSVRDRKQAVLVHNDVERLELFSYEYSFRGIDSLIDDFFNDVRRFKIKVKNVRLEVQTEDKFISEIKRDMKKIAKGEGIKNRSTLSFESMNAMRSFTRMRG